MTTQELRIGNWVNNGFGKPLQILGIISEENTGGYKLSTLQPIPLTPEILERAGFEKHKNSNEYWNFYCLKNGWYVGEALHTEPSAGVKMGFYYWGDYHELKYLHQLQNLFWCLCGEELNYTP